LEEAASLSRKFATTLCKRSKVSIEDCSYYHGGWATLRAFGVITGATTEADFLVKQFKIIARSKENKKILICGAADHAILQIVLAGYSRIKSAIPKITVLDTCATTLLLNCWYAEKMGIQIETIHSNLFDCSLSEEFDAITTHGFFTMIPQERHLDIITKWRDLLRPGGRVIFAQNWRPPISSVSPMKFNQNQISDFVELVKNTWKSNSDLQSTISMPEIEQIALKFAKGKTVHQSPTADMLSDMLKEVGFKFVNVEAINREVLPYRSSNPPGVDKQSFSLRVFATRP